MEERAYGKTGEKFPILSLGAMHIVDAEGCFEKDAIRIVNYALDNGIRYFDTAHWYWEGQSEERLGLVAKNRRKEMWLATKTLERTRVKSRKQLEESLKRLQTDYIDEWRMHYVWSFEELERITATGGALETAVKACKEGLIRFISISNHGNPAVQLKALELFPFDSVLFPASIFDRFILSFVDELLPVMKSKGVASAGMKIMARGKASSFYDKALRYAFSQPIDTAVVGVNKLEQLKKNLSIAENYRPLDDREKLDLYKKVLPKVTPNNIPWKAEDWDNPVEWLKR